MALVLEVTYETAAGLRDDVKEQLSRGGFFAAVEGAASLPPFQPLTLRLHVLSAEGAERVIQLAGRLTAATADSLCLELDEPSRAQLPSELAGLDDDARAPGWRTVALVDETRPVRKEQPAPMPLDRKIATMSVSEKVQLALHGDRDARMLLLRERAGVVQASLVRNPKATLDEMTALARSSLLAPDAAEALSRHTTYGESAQIAHALCRNPRTPIPVAVSMIERLNPTDLRVIAKGLGVRPQVAQAARKKLL